MKDKKIQTIIGVILLVIAITYWIISWIHPEYSYPIIDRLITIAVIVLSVFFARQNKE